MVEYWVDSGPAIRGRDCQEEMMRVGIIGAGSLGTALAKRLTLAGHSVRLSFGRDTEKLAATAAKFGVGHGAPADVKTWADVIAIAVPWHAVQDAITQLGDLNGAVLWDCTNSLNSDMSALEIGTTTSAGEELQRQADGARVVKGIPTFAELLHSDDPLVAGRPAGMFVAGDDAEAKAAVIELMTDLPGTVVDTGGLDAARFIEPVSMLLVRLAYRQGLGARISLGLTQ
ncbi:NADPH-dependent F420 reductase [Nocardia sp. NPDC057030]|uniref:NADPH-dependent F420 reductase n=1 Tax=unclassified Nocardia TaxID=2637762 RepID=UPI003638A25B